MGRIARNAFWLLAVAAVIGCGRFTLPSPPAVAMASDDQIALRFDVENRTERRLIVSTATDVAAFMPEFEAGQRGTVFIPLDNPRNGIGVEIYGEPGCVLLGNATCRHHGRSRWC